MLAEHDIVFDVERHRVLVARIFERMSDVSPAKRIRAIFAYHKKRTDKMHQRVMLDIKPLAAHVQRVRIYRDDTLEDFLQRASAGDEWDLIARAVAREFLSQDPRWKELLIIEMDAYKALYDAGTALYLDDVRCKLSERRERYLKMGV